MANYLDVMVVIFGYGDEAKTLEKDVNDCFDGDLERVGEESANAFTAYSASIRYGYHEEYIERLNKSSFAERSERSGAENAVFVTFYNEGTNGIYQWQPKVVPYLPRDLNEHEKFRLKAYGDPYFRPDPAESKPSELMDILKFDGKE